MKIYFAGSIRGGREDKEFYLQIIKYLEKYGQILTEHIGDQNLTQLGEDLPDQLVYNRDLSWIKESDVIIAEVSKPSLGVGYEIGKAEELNKKVLCLHREQDGKKLSAMISGNKNLKIINYKNLEEVFKCIDDFFNVIKSR